VFWMVYDKGGTRQVLIQPASALIYARFRAALDKTIDGDFVEGHQLQAEQIKRIPKTMIGKPLTLKQAAALLEKLT
jgi:hypothetical protein